VKNVSGKLPVRIFISFISITFAFGQVVITEVLFDPDCPLANQEFVEIFNLGPDPVDITGWSLADNHSIDELVSDFSWLEVGEFAVILEQDYSECFDLVFPDEVNYIFVDDNSIGNGLGNSADVVHLINATGDTVSTVSWAAGITHGHSLEKIVPDFDNIPENWRESIDLLGTPGSQNSIASQLIDVGIDSVWVVPDHPRESEIFDIIALFSNSGLVGSQTNISVNGEVVYSLWIDPFQSVQIPLLNTSRESGTHQFLIDALAAEDYNTENDTISITVSVAYDYGNMLINEIMYDPLTGNPEWVEIANATSSEISVLGWRINDKDEFQSSGISTSDTISVFGFAVVTKDTLNPGNIYQSNFPTLNNSEDHVYLFDPSGKMIDHVFYESWWGGGDGFSLERVTHFLDSNYPQNWGTCVSDSGATPGIRNSLFAEQITSDGVITVHPNPFSPDGDGYEDETIISYRVPFTQAYIHAVIYDVRGREIDTLFDQVSAAEGIFRWDGKMKSGYRCKTGQYILILEASDSWTKSVWKGNARIIVANHLK